MTKQSDKEQKDRKPTAAELKAQTAANLLVDAQNHIKHGKDLAAGVLHQGGMSEKDASGTLASLIHSILRSAAGKSEATIKGALKRSENVVLRRIDNGLKLPAPRAWTQYKSDAIAAVRVADKQGLNAAQRREAFGTSLQLAKQWKIAQATPWVAVKTELLEALNAAFAEVKEMEQADKGAAGKLRRDAIVKAMQDCIKAVTTTTKKPERTTATRTVRSRKGRGRPTVISRTDGKVTETRRAGKAA